MTINLPALVPSTREFLLPVYPTSDITWRGDVAVYPRRWSDIPVGARLRLGYKNIDDEDAAQFLTCWDDSLTGVFPVSLPESVVSGINDTDLASRIRFPKGLSWRFAQPPTVANVIPGVSTITIELVAEPGFSRAETSSVDSGLFGHAVVLLGVRYHNEVIADDTSITNDQDTFVYRIYSGDCSTFIENEVPTEYGSCTRNVVPTYLFNSPYAELYSPPNYYTTDNYSNYYYSWIRQLSNFEWYDPDLQAVVGGLYGLNDYGTYFESRRTTAITYDSLLLPVTNSIGIVVIFMDSKWAVYDYLSTMETRFTGPAFQSPAKTSVKTITFNPRSGGKTYMSCYIVTKTSVRQISAPIDLRDKLAAMSNIEHVSSQYMDYDFLEYLDVSRNDQLFPAQVPVGPKIEAKFIQGLNDFPTTGNSNYKSYGLMPIVGLEPYQSTYYGSAYQLSSPAIYSFIDYLYTNSSNLSTTAWYQDIYNPTLSKTWLSSYTDIEPTIYAPVRTSSTMLGGNPTWNLDVAPFQYALYTGILPNRDVYAFSAESPEGITLNNPDVTLLPDTIIPSVYVNVEYPGETIPSWDYQDYPDGSFFQFEAGARWRFTGWSNPDYCRQQLLALGFTEADLVP